MEGWIKLHRKSLDWLSNPELWAVWCYCLLRANHKPTSVYMGLQKVDLEAGEFVAGRKAISRHLNLSESKIYRLLRLLSNFGNIRVKSNSKFSIIYVVNWATYQSLEDESEQQVNNKRTTNEQQMNTDKNVRIKEYNNIKDIYMLKPTVEEIRAYCLKRKNQVDAERFFDFYESKGWKVGKNAMKSWEACIRTWEKNGKGGETLASQYPKL